MKQSTLVCLILLSVACSTGRSGDEPNPDKRIAAAATGQETSVAVDPRWDMRKAGFLGPAISYSGYRAGQSPNTGVHPTRAQIAEDLHILAKHWRLIRIYGSDTYGEAILAVIRKENIDLKVMLGAWLGKEPGNEAINTTQVDNVIRLANEYPDVVIAVNVGNEVLVGWTAHPVPEDKVIGYVRRVKRSVSVPVTVADNYAWWRDHGAALASEVDFVAIHTYPVWERRGIDEALSYTVENYEQVRRALPGKNIVITEAGWPTYTEGNQHVPRAGSEEKQKRYLEEMTTWAEAQQVTVFFFEAFDEPWKGTGTEGHWGLFSVDRKAKLSMQDLYPELMPDGPTSPDYADQPSHWGPNGAVAFREKLAAQLGHCSVNPLGPGLRLDSVAEDTLSVEGESSLRFAHDGSDWGGVYLLFDPVDGSAYSKLVMRLNVPDDVAALELKVEGPPTQAGSVNLIPYLTDAGEGGWKTFAVPLSDLANVDRSQVAVLGWWNPKSSSGSFVACEIRVDDIHFE